MSLMSLSFSASYSSFELVSVSLDFTSASSSVESGEGDFFEEVNVTKSSVPTSLRSETILERSMIMINDH